MTSVLESIKSQNLNPKQLALLASIVVGTGTGAMVYLFTQNLSDTLIAFSVIALITYFLFKFLLNNFIYKKLRLIYRLIISTKSEQKTKEFFDQELTQKTIQDVHLDVKKWSDNKNLELEQLKENNEYRKQFLQNLSHELKTPIFTIQGYIETLLEGAMDNSEVASKFLYNASKGVDRLVALTESIDSISRLESNMIELKYTNFYIYRLIQDVFEELTMKAERDNITLKLPPKTTEKIQVRADKDQVKQVIVNLVQNAIKYCDEGDIIDAKIFELDGSNILVEISDTGPGIESEHIDRVFERFYRTDASRSRNIGGTGLGLAISKHIIEAHNQTITCRSKVGVGTTLGFTLDKA